MLLAASANAFRLQQIADLLSNPLVLFAAVGLLAMSLASMLTGRGRLTLVTLMVTASVFAVFTQHGQWLRPPAPLDTMSLYGRTVTAGLLAALCLSALMPPKRSPLGFVMSPVAVTLLFFQISYCLRFMIEGYQGEALQRLLAFSAVFLVMGIGLPNWMDEGRAFGRLLFYLVLSLAVICFCDLYGSSVAPSKMEHNGRFFGIGGNQNHMAIDLVGYYPAMLAFLSLTTRSKVWKVGVLFLLMLSVVFVIWTGSRSGAWTGALMVLVFYRRRLKALLLLGAASGLIFSYMFIGMFAESDDQGERLISTENTRLGEWEYGMDLFSQSPIFGMAENGFNVRPGSYLTLLAYMGIVGVFLFLPFVVACFMLLAKLWKIPKSDDGSNLDVIGDMVISAIVGFAFHAIFEGTLFANLSFAVLAIYLYIAFGQVAVRIHQMRTSGVAAGSYDAVPAHTSLQGVG